MGSMIQTRSHHSWRHTVRAAAICSWETGWAARRTNIVTSAVISIRAGCRIKDSQSGYRLIRAEVVRNVELVTERYETESEILIKAAHMGARISSVPVRTIYGTEQSTINPIADTFRFFVLVIRSIFW
jgi:hypothetical protein